MAARSGAGTGVVVGLVVFVLSTIFLLVLTIVYYAKSTEAGDEAAAAVADLDSYASRVDRNSDSFKAVVAAASSARRSVMRHMMEEQAGVMAKVTGNRAASPADLDTQLQSFATDTDATYIDTLRQATSDLRGARAEASASQDLISSLNDQIQEKNALLEEAERSKQQEVQAVRDLIATFMSDVQRYGQDVAQTKAQMLQMVDRLESTFDAQINALESNLDSLRSDLAIRETQLAVFQRIIDDIRLRTKDPAMLVDGTILDNANSQGQVYISRGRDDHIVLGMTFEVYDDAAAIAPGPDGNLPRGKASIQIITVDKTTALAKVVRPSRGRPVVRGDVLANAIYDPDKEYMFLVHGKFDVNGDGRPSESEANFVRSLVTDWGGTNATGNVLRGDMDFLLLGAQPTLPGDPPASPSPIQIEIWVEQNQAYQTYNDLLRDAMNANIPVLNQNRFFILIGHTNG